jgi:hypothetical protein
MNSMEDCCDLERMQNFKSFGGALGQFNKHNPTPKYVLV